MNNVPHTSELTQENGWLRQRVAELESALAQQGRDNTHWLRSMAETSPLPIIITRRADSTLLYANSRFEATFHVPTATLIGQRTPNYYASSTDRRRVMTRLQRKGSVANEEVLLKRADGVLFWTLISISPVSFAGEAALISYIIDINKRKWLEQELDEQASWFCSLAETPALPMVITRRTDGLVLYANSHVEQTFGTAAAAMLGQNMPERYINQADWLRILARVERERIASNEEVRLKRSDGTPFWALVSMSGVIFQGKDALVSSIYDISARNHQQETLRLAEARFRTIFDRALPGIGLGDATGRIVDSNPALQQMLGYRHAELARMSFADLAHPDDRAASSAAYAQVLQGERDHDEIALRYLHKTGYPIRVQVAMSLFPDDQAMPRSVLSLVQAVSQRGGA